MQRWSRQSCVLFSELSHRKVSVTAGTRKTEWILKKTFLYCDDTLSAARGHTCMPGILHVTWEPSLPKTFWRSRVLSYGLTRCQGKHCKTFLHARRTQLPREGCASSGDHWRQICSWDKMCTFPGSTGLPNWSPEADQAQIFPRRKKKKKVLQLY